MLASAPRCTGAAPARLRLRRRCRFRSRGGSVLSMAGPGLCNGSGRGLGIGPAVGCSLTHNNTRPDGWDVVSVLAATACTVCGPRTEDGGSGRVCLSLSRSMPAGRCNDWATRCYLATKMGVRRYTHWPLELSMALCALGGLVCCHARDSARPLCPCASIDLHTHFSMLVPSTLPPSQAPARRGSSAIGSLPRRPRRVAAGAAVWGGLRFHAVGLHGGHGGPVDRPAR